MLREAFHRLLDLAAVPEENLAQQSNAVTPSTRQRAAIPRSMRSFYAKTLHGRELERGSGPVPCSCRTKNGGLDAKQ